MNFTGIPQRLRMAFMAMLVVLAISVAGYMLIERWNFADALYMTVITLGTVGYGETHPLSPAGRAFTMVLIIGGTSILLYALSSVTAFLVEGDLGHLIRRRKMDKAASRLREHVIVCGSDQTGRVIIDELKKTMRDFAVIERDPETVGRLIGQGIIAIEGNATDDHVLHQAGILHAKGLITVLPDDRDNLFVVLTARGINTGLRIVSKMVEPESETKLRRAGADAVVSTNLIGGLRLVSEMVRPAVVSFLDTMLRERDHAWRIEEVEVVAGSIMAGKRLGDTHIPDRTGVIVVAVKRPAEGSHRFNPAPDTILEPGHILIVMGYAEQIHKLRAVGAPV